MKDIAAVVHDLHERLLTEACDEMARLGEELQPRVNSICDDYGLRFVSRMGFNGFYPLEGKMVGKPIQPFAQFGRSELEKLAYTYQERERNAILEIATDLAARLDDFEIPITDYLYDYDPREL